MNIYIMRHSETDWNKLLKIQGSTDIPLNQEGIKLAEKVSDSIYRNKIFFDKIYSSPLIRAKKTAEIMNKYSNVSIILDDRLKEFHFGQAEGVSFEELKTNPKFSSLKNWFLDPKNYKAEFGSESYESFFGRIDSFIDDLKKETFKNILVVCHGGVVRGLLKEISNWSIEQFASVKIPNCGLNLVKYENGKFFVEYTAKLFV